MKLSNNALNFLLAQYRAIFKRAYIKGLASAVILTAGLAAGQAQAVNLADNFQSGDAITTGAFGDIFETTDEKIASGLTVNAGHSLTTSGAIIVSSGASLAGDLTIKSGHILLANKENNQTVYRYDLTGNNVNVNLSGNIGAASFKLTGGTLELTSGGAGNTNLTAYGNGWIQETPQSQAAGYDRTTANGTLSDVDVTVNSGTNVAALNLLTINSDSKVTLAASSKDSGISSGDTAYLEGSRQMQISDSTIDVSGYANGIFSKQGSITGSTININDNGTLFFAGNADNYTEVLSSSSEAKLGNHTLTDTKISIGSGATLIVAKGTPDPKAGEAADAVTTLELASGSTLSGTGTLKVLGGLKIDGDILESFVSGSGKVNTSGGFSVIEFSDDTDLAQFTYSGGDSANFKIEGNTTFKGTDLTVSSVLTSGGNGAVTDAKDEIKIDATNLTLGSSTFNDNSSQDFGFAEATTQNLTVDAADDTLTLVNKVTLSATREVKQGDEIIIEGDSGTIKGNIIVSGGATGGLTVEHGSYTNNGNITVSGGTITVTNSAVGEDADQYVNTSWKLSGILTLDANGNDGKIEIDGTNQGTASTVLDITDAQVVVSGHDSQMVSVNVKNGGTLLTDSTNLLNLVSTDGKSGAGVYINKGSVEVDENLTLDAAKLTSGTQAANNQIVFDKTAGNGGTLQVNGGLTINGVTGLDISADGAIIAETLTLNNENDNADADTAVVQSGKYLAQSALNSHDTSDTIHISGSNAKVFLGDFNEITAGTDTYYEAVSETGSINSNLKISDSGELTVQAGAWTGSNIDVEAGTLNVGLAESTQGFDGIGVKHNSADDVIGASLTLSDLKVGTAGAATIAAGSELDVTTLTVKADTAGDFKVAGVVNVTGKYTPESTKDSVTTPASYGVDLSGVEGSIKVTQGGVLSFGAEATQAITLDPASDAADKDAIAVASGSFGPKIFSVDAGGTIAFSFSESQTFSADALADMRTKLFADVGTDGLIDGTINLGAAKLDGVKADKDGAYKWDDLQGYSDVADFTTDDIKVAVVKGIESTDAVRGHFGALKAESMNAGTQINIVGDTSLNNAAATPDSKFAVGNGNALLGLNVTEAALVQLNNGGAIGRVTMADGATLSINHDQSITAPSKTTIESIIGGTAQFGVGESEVTGRTEVNNLINNAGTVTFKDRVTVGDASSSSDAETLLGGVATTFEQDATFYNDTEIAGGMTTFQDGVTFNNWTGIYGDTTVSGGAVLSSGAEIGGAATLTADSIKLAANPVAGSTGIRFSVGEEDYVENGQTFSGSTGYLQTASMVLNGNTLIVDPSYDHATSIAAIEDFDDVANTDEDAGTFNGTIFVGQNAALGVGQDITVAAVAEFIKQYQNSQGALIQDQVGSVLYLDGMLTAADGSQLILDSQHTQAQVFDGTSTASALINDGSTYWGKFGTETTARQADLYLGQNTIMAVSDNILSQGAAIHFESDDAAIMAQSVKDSSDAAKIVLDGNGFLDSRNVTLFTDNGNGTGNETATGVKILGDQDIRVETLNGVMYFMLRHGEETTGGTLQLDTTKLDTAFLGATDDSRDLLFAYASQTANWDEYFAEANLAKDDSDETKVQREQLHGAAASSHLYTYDPTNSTNRFQLSQAAQDAGYQTSDFVVIEHTDDEGNTTAEVYHRAYNDLLERIVRDTNGAATDGAALQGVFGGAAQAALLAARTSQDAVAGRTGVGATKSALTFADNGQGAGLWVAPIYVSQDSDGFAVSNKDYGVDIDLYGVALGGDYTLSNGLRVGAFFNVGSGDADGNGQAGGVSNDFDYYGVGLYAGYSLGQFSLVGDVSYTVVDSDIDASTQVGSIKSSFDTDNISVGVTGQYEFVLGGTQITPHAGLRYSALSFDDSTFAAGGYDNGGHSELDDVNVFSIPVGVTVAKEFAFDTWTVKPSLDVTLQGNFGDDELDSNAQWDGVAWQSTYTAEFLDNFTYGATLGVAASTGSFSAGLGLGYTGSENTDEFSATANARFTF